MTSIADIRCTSQKNPTLLQGNACTAIMGAWCKYGFGGGGGRAPMPVPGAAPGHGREFDMFADDGLTIARAPRRYSEEADTRSRNTQYVQYSGYYQIDYAPHRNIFATPHAFGAVASRLMHKASQMAHLNRERLAHRKDTGTPGERRVHRLPGQVQGEVGPS